jgi:hypothetical protein
LDDVLAGKPCLKWGCTTCENHGLRQGVMTAVRSEFGWPPVLESPDVPPGNALDHRTSVAIALALATLSGTTGDKWQAVRLILAWLWYAEDCIGRDELEALLEGSPAGDLLASMKAHHAALEKAQREEKEQEPARRAERKRLRQRLREERHAERLERKKERDRIWQEQHPEG